MELHDLPMALWVSSGCSDYYKLRIRLNVSVNSCFSRMPRSTSDNPGSASNMGQTVRDSCGILSKSKKSGAIKVLPETYSSYFQKLTQNLPTHLTVSYYPPLFTIDIRTLVTN